MPIIDINAWTGSGMTCRLPGTVDQVLAALARAGVERACLTPLDAIWHHNPHLANDDLFAAARTHPQMLPVPLLDPTVPTWPEELDRAAGEQARMVKLVPAYSQYDMAVADSLLDAVQEKGLAVVVQVRVEDPRHHHPLAQVPDYPAEGVAQMARKRRGLRVVIGGAATGSILALRGALAEVPDLYADLSQADGMDAVRRLVDAGLVDKLLFGTHAPVFEPLAGLARVLPELDDSAAWAILGGNAARLLGL
jgi:predicted TIM-barrel fold metal-dependent hydrolase